MKKVVLIDLEKNPVQAEQIRHYIEQDQSVYMFNLKGRFDYAFADMTELASWMNAGYVTLLDVPQMSQKEFAYALIAGQFMALLEPDVTIELISNRSSIYLLVDLLQSSGRKVKQQQSLNQSKKNGYSLPNQQSFKTQPILQQIKIYCDALAEMPNLPADVDHLRDSIAEHLKLSADQIDPILAMMIELKIIKKNTQQLRFRNRNLKKWIEHRFDTTIEPVQSKSIENLSSVLKQKAGIAAVPQVVVGDVDSIMQFLQQQQPEAEGPFPPELDDLQWQVLQKLDELQHQRPKDIFSLRDQLHHWFPQADIQLLMKSLFDKGYIQLSDDQLHYSPQMVIH